MRGEGVQDDCSSLRRKRAMSEERQKHISSERERRLRMSSLLDSLEAVLPEPPRPRRDRCMLLTDATAYLQELESQVQALAAQKAQMKTMQALTGMMQSVRQSGVKPTINVVMREAGVRKVRVEPIDDVNVNNSCGSEQDNAKVAMITFVSSSSPGLIPAVMMHLHTAGIDVLSMNLSSTSDGLLLHYIHAQVPDKLQPDTLNLLLSQMTQQAASPDDDDDDDDKDNMHSETAS